MGYTTAFWGEWTIVPPLTEPHRLYLAQFAESRRMARDPAKLEPDPLREAAGLPPGVEGEYFVGEKGKYDQDYGPNRPGDSSYKGSVINGNSPASTQPGLWCQWRPSEDGSVLEWDEGEKFYNYVEWLKYLVTNFLTPWGYSLCGVVSWEGEESDDFGQIKIESPSNEVLVAHGSKSYGSFQAA